MARIPQFSASRQLDTGSVVQYPSGSPVGAAISNLGGALQGVAERFKAIQDKKDAFDTTLRENEMSAAISAMEQDAVKNAPADGSGIHDGVYGQIDPTTNTAVKPGSFDALFDSYLERVPESKRGEFAAMRETYRLRGSNRLAAAQYGAQQDYYKVEIQKTENNIVNSIMQMDPNDAATFDAYKKNGLDIIEKSGLPALEKDVAKANWEAKAEFTLGENIIANDPQGALKLREMLGFGSQDDAAGPASVSIVVDKIIGVESGGNPNAQNSRSSASGLGQFTDSTWVATVRKNRPDIARGLSNDQIIELKTDPALGREMTGRLVQENADGLRAAGIEPNERNLYLAHFAGLSGAKQILGAAEDEAISSVLSPAAIKANPQLAGKTVGDVKNWASRKMGKVSSAVAGPAPNVQFIDATQGKIRDKPVQTWVKDGLARAAAATDPRIAIKIVSGGQDGAQRTGSTRHDHGNAADIVLVVDGKEVKPSENKALYAAFFRNAAANGFKGLGHYEWGIHVGGGAQAAWGPDKSSRTLDPEFAKAAAEGWDNPVKAGQRQVDPRFANMTADQRQQLANKALAAHDNYVKDQAAIAKAEYGSYKDAVELQIVRGELMDEELVVKDQILKDGDKASLIRSLRSQNESANQIRSDMSALTAGTLTLDPYGSKDKTRVDNLYSDMTKRVPPEQQVAVADAIVSQTGIVPQPIINMMRRGLASDNPAEVVAAAQAAQRVSAFDSAALGRRDGGDAVQTAADLFSHYTNNVGLQPAEAARRLIDANDPDKVKARKALLESEETKKFVKGAATETNVRNIFDPGVFGFDPKLGENPAQAAAMVGEYRAILEESLIDAQGDRDAAKDLAGRRFARIYRPSALTFNTGVVMRLPPEATYPPDEDGTHEYIRQQAIDALAEQDIVTDKIFLQTDENTDDDFRAGKAARYRLYYEKDGEIEMFNFPFSATPPVVSRNMEQNVERWQENRRQLEAGRDRDRTLDNFLDGNPLTGGK